MKGQFQPIQDIMHREQRETVEARYLMPYQRIWKILYAALCRIDAPHISPRLVSLAQSCLENICVIDELWLPSSRIDARTDAIEEFNTWAQLFDPREAFFDDGIIKVLVKYLPSAEYTKYKRVRRVLWMQDQTSTSPSVLKLDTSESRLHTGKYTTDEEMDVSDWNEHSIPINPHAPSTSQLPGFPQLPDPESPMHTEAQDILNEVDLRRSGRDPGETICTEPDVRDDKPPNSSDATNVGRTDHKGREMMTVDKVVLRSYAIIRTLTQPLISFTKLVAYRPCGPVPHVTLLGIVRNAESDVFNISGSARWG